MPRIMSSVFAPIRGTDSNGFGRDGSARALLACAVGAVLGSWSLPAAAQSDWEFSFDVYGWFPLIEGDVEIAGQSVGVDLNTVDVLQDADDVAAAIFRVEGTNGEWGAWTDVVYMDLTFENFTTAGPANVIPVNIETEFSQLIWETAVFYRAFDNPSGGPGGSRLSFDLYGGVRYIDFETDITATAGPVLRQASSSTDWVDPIIGARLILGEPVGVNAVFLADMGGFGAGSEFAWQAAAYLGYGFSLGDGIDLDLFAGYRALGFDYEDGRSIDVTFHGPVVGASLIF